MLVFGGEFGDGAAGELEGMIALGDERTFDQDPTFALRIMVDTANKALSPAVNDPTTAVQVLDHIGEVLSFVGQTDLGVREKGVEPGSTVAVTIVTRRWEDVVMLGFTEIREFGATSVQVHAAAPGPAGGASCDRAARAPSSGRGRTPPS